MRMASTDPNQKEVKGEYHMSKTIKKFYLAGLLAVTTATPCASAAVILGGTASFTFDNNSMLFTGGSGPFIMDRSYGTGVATRTAAEILGGIGGDAITVPGSGLVLAGAVLNGASAGNPIGRSRQATNLEVATNNLLATWGLGEQIGIDFVLRTNVDPLFGGGSIVLGDFSLVNNAGTLVLMNNFSFPADAFTIGSPVFTDLGNGFSVSGDLLVSTSLSFLTGGAVAVGTNAGSFSMTAIPEPSSAVLFVVAAGGITVMRRRRHF
jgi:hypothetical protein